MQYLHDDVIILNKDLFKIYNQKTNEKVFATLNQIAGWPNPAFTRLQ